MHHCGNMRLCSRVKSPIDSQLRCMAKHGPDDIADMSYSLDGVSTVKAGCNQFLNCVGGNLVEGQCIQIRPTLNLLRTWSEVVRLNTKRPINGSWLEDELQHPVIVGSSGLSLEQDVLGNEMMFDELLYCHMRQTMFYIPAYHRSVERVPANLCR
jgi:hypothetical protein